jgi:hypothetical protein
MPMIPVSGDDVIVVPQERYRPHCHRLLADIKMQKTAHFALVVELQGGLLETADADHLAQASDLLLGTYRVDRRL